MLGRRGGQRARRWGGYSTFFSLADASGFARRAGWERPNRSFVLGFWHYGVLRGRAAPARAPGPESQVRPILIFARHCLLPDVGHRFAQAPSSRQSWPARSDPPISDQGAARARLLDRGTQAGPRFGRLGGSVVKTRILVGTAPKARRDGANAALISGSGNPRTQPEH